MTPTQLREIAARSAAALSHRDTARRFTHPNDRFGVPTPEQIVEDGAQLVCFVGELLRLLKANADAADRRSYVELGLLDAATRKLVLQYVP
jgi:hypothetical protein